MRLRKTMLSFASIGILFACGSSTPDAAHDSGTPSTGNTSHIVGSCTGGKESGCTQTTCCQDYAGSFTAATSQSSCAAIAGSYSSNPCPTENRVGSCVLYSGTAAEQSVRYYTEYAFLDTPAGAASAAANCAALHIGTFQP